MNTAPMHIEIDDLTRPEIHDLLAEHLQNMHSLSPRESVHALDIDALRAPEVTFWSVWQEGVLLGCGALKELDATHGEVKSMRTRANLRRRGAGIHTPQFGDRFVGRVLARAAAVREFWFRVLRPVCGLC
jgi:N-acetylglutamate synthase-like GNAT family acetyltransferase